MHMSKLPEDKFEDAIKELTIASFANPRTSDSGGKAVVTEYSMLSLTRGFIDAQLDADPQIRRLLSQRYASLTGLIEEHRKGERLLIHSRINLGIKTNEEILAYDLVRTARMHAEAGNYGEAEKNFKLARQMAPRLTLVYVEHSKFEWDREHTQQALILAKEATLVEQKSWEAWLHYGVLLRNTNSYEDSAECLKKAEDLNPGYPQICMELGRSYSFLGEFEKADTKYRKTLEESDYMSPRQKALTLEHMAGNYLNWAQLHEEKRIHDSQIANIEKALEYSQQAISVEKFNTFHWRMYRRACKDMGVALTKRGSFDKGKDYLEKAVGVLPYEGRTVPPDPEVAREGYFYLARFTKSQPNHDTKQVESYIKKGLLCCSPDSKWHRKLLSLSPEMQNQLSGGNRKTGIVRFFDVNRQFGLIDTEGKTSIFFPSCFRDVTGLEKLLSIGGRAVSYVEESNPVKKGTVAKDILLADD